MFSCEFCKVFKNTFLKNTSWRLVVGGVIQVMKDEGFINKLYYITVLY